MTDAELGFYVRARVATATRDKNDLHTKTASIVLGNKLESNRDRMVTLIMTELIADIAEAVGVE